MHDNIHAATTGSFKACAPGSYRAVCVVRLQATVEAPQGATLQLLRVLGLVGETGGAEADDAAAVDLSLLDDIPAALWQVRAINKDALSACGFC